MWVGRWEGGQGARCGGTARQGGGGRRRGAARQPLLHTALGRRTVCDAQTVFELRLDAELGEPGVDLGAAAVHHHRVDAHAGQQHQVAHHAGLVGAAGAAAAAGDRGRGAESREGRAVGRSRPHEAASDFLRRRSDAPPWDAAQRGTARRSAAQRTLRVSSFIAAPPYLTTTVLPRKRCR